VDLAATADVVVLVVGDKAGLRDDCTSGESRDVASLDLPGVQEELARAVIDTGTPTVLVLVAGRPYGSARLHESCAAVVHAWLPGPQGAGAIADVIFGAVNPSGRLPLSYPRHAGQIPIFYGHKVSGGRSHWKGDYVDLPARPLYPFGHGLTYTTFTLTDARVEGDVVAWNGAIRTQVTVSNTGEREGDELVQLYVHDPAASVTRPVLELKGFARVRLAPGESKDVVFTVPVGQLGYHGRDLAYVVDPGRLEVKVGSSSVDVIDAGTVEIVTDANGNAPVKAFEGSVAILDR
jgi:beta-glucosidase